MEGAAEWLLPIQTLARPDCAVTINGSTWTAKHQAKEEEEENNPVLGRNVANEAPWGAHLK